MTIVRDLMQGNRIKEYKAILGEIGRAYNEAKRCAFESWERRERELAKIRMEELIPDVRFLCDVVNSLHALDAIADGKIPNNKFAWNRVLPYC